ncbi:hypothetical protein FA15DRAFT_666191 [Coprinopsis marcescibilis]|uniref:Uncharacterized protein n=1 Tax=Coprinopsis marcescibilis TaxID=230819 RepID=A0A5C3L3Z1_COPMA|nr:hypothetical protein FA15DRAFT_666191 [Coprinopsis marcescibilis]
MAAQHAPPPVEADSDTDLEDQIYSDEESATPTSPPTSCHRSLASNPQRCASSVSAPSPPPTAASADDDVAVACTPSPPQTRTCDASTDTPKPEDQRGLRLAEDCESDRDCDSEEDDEGDQSAHNITSTTELEPEELQDPQIVDSESEGEGELVKLRSIESPEEPDPLTAEDEEDGIEYEDVEVDSDVEVGVGRRGTSPDVLDIVERVCSDVGVCAEPVAVSSNIDTETRIEAEAEIETEADRHTSPPLPQRPPPGPNFARMAQSLVERALVWKRRTTTVPRTTLVPMKRKSTERNVVEELHVKAAAGGSASAGKPVETKRPRGRPPLKKRRLVLDVDDDFSEPEPQVKTRRLTPRHAPLPAIEDDSDIDKVEDDCEADPLVFNGLGTSFRLQAVEVVRNDENKVVQTDLQGGVNEELERMSVENGKRQTTPLYLPDPDDDDGDGNERLVEVEKETEMLEREGFIEIAPVPGPSPFERLESDQPIIVAPQTRKRKRPRKINERFKNFVFKRVFGERDCREVVPLCFKYSQADDTDEVHAMKLQSQLSFQELSVY